VRGPGHKARPKWGKMLVWGEGGIHAVSNWGGFPLRA